jgi:hypothetical protein
MEPLVAAQRVLQAPDFDPAERRHQNPGGGKWTRAGFIFTPRSSLKMQ